jgi:lysine 2,3-aminomutase
MGNGLPHCSEQNHEKGGGDHMKRLMHLTKEEILGRLWKAEPQVKTILRDARHLEEARYVLFDYLDRLRRDLYNMKSGTYYAHLTIVEKRNVRECVRVLSNIMRTENEELTGTSMLDYLYRLAKEEPGALEEVSKGFLVEVHTLFLGVRGKYGKHSKQHEYLEEKSGRDAAIERSAQLDSYAHMMQRYFKRYSTGLNKKLIKERNQFKETILRYFGAAIQDWDDYQWHMKHIIKDAETLSALVELSGDEKEGLLLAGENHLPFEITPHYLSLFTANGLSEYDRAIRAQVIPSVRYASNVVQNRTLGKDMDFMGEKVTSPTDGITRRYPQIVILKPFNSCPQICVYCQRNWEIKDLDADVMLSREKVTAAIEWIKHDKNITEVLVTGGDPLTLTNTYLEWLLGELAAIDHVERIRIGSRILVTLPQRIDDGLIALFKKYHEWGRREIAVVTHFEHPTELTPESLEAITKIRQIGMNIYNQQVFTYFNSRKFESAFLRKSLKLSGIDPYYSFNCMGKEETIDFRVPIARIEQERKEEARLLPGLTRTDEPVFNVPRLGKSYLQAWQDHEVVMLLPDGRRIYRFYSWETTLTTSQDYLYTDVGIYEYIERLHADGENVKDYTSIWYYF